MRALPGKASGIDTIVRPASLVLSYGTLFVIYVQTVALNADAALERTTSVTDAHLHEPVQ